MGGKRLQEISLKIGGGDGGKDLVWILAIKIVAGIQQRNGCKKFW